MNQASSQHMIRAFAFFLVAALLGALISVTGPAQPAWASHFIGVEPKVDLVWDGTKSRARITVKSVWDSSPSSASPNSLKKDDGTTVASNPCATETSGSGNTPTYVFTCSLDSLSTAGLYYFEWASGNRINNFNTTSSASFSYQVGFYFDPTSENPEVSGWYGSPRFTSALQTTIGAGQSFSQNLGAQSVNVGKNSTLTYSFIEDTTGAADKNGAPVSGTKDGGSSDAGAYARAWSSTSLAGVDLATLTSDGDLQISSTVSSFIASSSYNDLAMKIRVEERDGDGDLIGFVSRDLGVTFFATSNNAPVISGFSPNQEFRVVAGASTPTTFTITASDQDGDALSIGLGGTFPSGWATAATQNNSTSGGVTTATRSVTLQPTSSESARTVIVEVTATDDGGPSNDVVLTASRSFRIVVVVAPEIDSVSTGQVVISWVNPTLEVGETLTGTKVQYSSDGGSTWSLFETVTGTGDSATVTGLTNGTSYVFRTIPQVDGSDGTPSSESDPAIPRGTQTIAWTLSASEKILLLSESGLTLGSDVRSATAQTTISYSVVNPGTASCSLDGSNSLTYTALGTCTVRATAAQAGAYQSTTLDVEFTIANVRPALQSGGDGGGTTQSAPIEPLVTVTPPLLSRAVPAPTPVATVQQGPVLRGNVPPAPPSAPVATIGGRSTPIQTQVTSPTGFSLTAGVLNLGLQVQEDQGVVRQNNTGGTEIEVRKGSTAEVSGTGFLPRSTVQVFLPLQGANAKEIARIPVDEAGTFSGDAVFATRVNERPLPIGKQVLQVVSLDEDGQQSVVEMTVNIAQSAPTPEPDRTVGATPTLRPGQFLATNAGEPEIVTVVPVPEDRQARVEGDGWQMAVDIPSANGSVARSDEGGAVLQLVRDETAVVSGTGFMPGTRADVWLFSEPTLLGTVDIDENGEFSGEVNIDSNVVVVGEHTLQLQGVGEDGYVRAANLGVVVNDTAAEATTEEAAGGFLWWLWLLVILVALVVWFAIWRYRRSREA